MKRALILLIGFGSFLQGMNARASDCFGMIKQFQHPPGVAEPVSVPGTMVNCDLVDYGQAIRSDFQSRLTGAPTVKVTQVKRSHPGFSDHGEEMYAKALQEYYGVRGMSLYANCIRAADSNGNPTGPCVVGNSDERGIPLFCKLSTALKATYPQDPDLQTYISGDPNIPHSTGPLYEANKPKSIQELGGAADSGSCEVWSAWSMDPAVRDMLAQVGDGILCGGMPFTKGELQELITTTYPDPQKSTTTYNLTKKGPNDTGYNDGANEASMEEANVTLSKLGAFGNNGDFTPGNIIAKARSLPKGDRLIMDLNPGNREVWNQPIEAILDVEYLDGNMSAHDLQSYLTSKDLGPPNSTLVSDIAGAEANLKEMALQGVVNGTPPDGQSASLAALRTQMIHEGYGMKSVGQETLSQQLAELKALQQALVDNHELTPVANQVTKHRLFIKYAPESTFAQNHSEKIKSEVRALDYVTVNGRDSWSPPTEMLSEACGSAGSGGNLADRLDKPGFGLVEDNILTKGCSELASGAVKDHPIATGKFPPKALKVFDQSKADAAAALDHGEKQKLFNHLHDMILSCAKPNGAPSFNTAADFLNDFDRTVMTNEISDADIARLKQEYLNAANFLDPNRAKDSDPTQPSIQDDLGARMQALGANPNQVAGLNQLYNSLFSQ